MGGESDWDAVIAVHCAADLHWAVRTTFFLFISCCRCISNTILSLQLKSVVFLYKMVLIEINLYYTWTYNRYLTLSCNKCCYEFVLFWYIVLPFCSTVTIWVVELLQTSPIEHHWIVFDWYLAVMIQRLIILGSTFTFSGVKTFQLSNANVCKMLLILFFLFLLLSFLLHSLSIGIITLRVSLHCLKLIMIKIAIPCITKAFPSPPHGGTVCCSTPLTSVSSLGVIMTLNCSNSSSDPERVSRGDSG